MGLFVQRYECIDKNSHNDFRRLCFSVAVGDVHSVSKPVSKGDLDILRDELTPGREVVAAVLCYS